MDITQSKQCRKLAMVIIKAGLVLGTLGASTCNAAVALNFYLLNGRSSGDLIYNWSSVCEVSDRLCGGDPVSAVLTLAPTYIPGTLLSPLDITSFQYQRLAGPTGTPLTVDLRAIGLNNGAGQHAGTLPGPNVPSSTPINFGIIFQTSQQFLEGIATHIDFANEFVVNSDGSWNLVLNFPVGFSFSGADGNSAAGSSRFTLVSPPTDPGTGTGPGPGTGTGPGPGTGAGPGPGTGAGTGTPVPEPMTLGLLAAGLAGLAFTRRKQV